MSLPSSGLKSKPNKALLAACFGHYIPEDGTFISYEISFVLIVLPFVL
jgi:hypothetical protein